MRWVLLIIAVIGMNAMAGDTDWVVVPDSLDPVKAKVVIEEIWEQSQVFWMERGRYPQSVEELIKSKYIVGFDSALLSRWDFRIEYTYPSSISAHPKVDYHAQGHKTQVGVNWFEEHGVVFDAITGHWSGAGIPKYGVDSLSIKQQAELVKDVLKAIENIDFWLTVYYSDMHRHPQSIKDLFDFRYLHFTPSVYAQWEFSLVGDPPVAIEATSSHVMPGGKGQVVQYNIVQKKFSGYGVEE